MVKKLNDDGILIEGNVSIGENVTIYPNVYLLGDTVIGDNVTIYPNTLIENSKIGEGTVIYSSHIFDSNISSNNKIGPYAHIRKGTNTSDKSKIGAFVETKNITLGTGSKLPHLSYIGDATIGDSVNVGCGVITANYDGKNKFKTVIEDNAFVGCNSVLVAPLTLEKNSFVAANSIITEDVPANKIAFGRAKQVIKDKK